MAFSGMTRMARYGRFLRRFGGKSRGLSMARLGLPIRRRMFRSNQRKKIVNKIHRYVRWADKDTSYPGDNGPSLILQGAGNQNLVYTFKLDNIVNPGDFTNLYDQYRINKVTLYMERIYNQTGDSAVSPYNQKISVVHDYNDANPLTQEDDYLEYSNCKRYNPIGNGAIKITLYPKINNIVENVGGASNAFTSMNSNKVWLNIQEDEVPHFGLKVFIPTGIATVGAAILRVRAKFDLSFKNSK